MENSCLQFMMSSCFAMEESDTAFILLHGSVWFITPVIDGLIYEDVIGLEGENCAAAG